MGRNGLIRVLVVLTAVLFACVAFAACGGSDGASKSEIAQAEKHGREEKAEKEKERKLERAIQKLKKERQQEKKRKKERERGAPLAPAPQPAPETTSAPESSGPSGTDCGGGVIAGPETSCGFALNVRSEYEYYIGQGAGAVEAYSEANDEVYSMYCTAAPHECSGAISATVYFP